MKTTDPIVGEIRKVREEWARKTKYDVRTIAAEAKAAMEQWRKTIPESGNHPPKD